MWVLAQDNFTRENIERLQKLSGNDPSLLERTVYAFGLLEAISKVGMPFIFKGCTCLVLLLDDSEEYINEKLSFKGARGINYLRKVNLKSYAYVVAAVRLLGNEVEEILYLREK